MNRAENDNFRTTRQKNGSFCESFSMHTLKSCIRRMGWLARSAGLVESRDIKVGVSKTGQFWAQIIIVMNAKKGSFLTQNDLFLNTNQH